MFETYVTVVGRVISDLQQRTLPSGDKLCSFRMASNERRFHKETQEWVDGDHLYIQVHCWRKLAENVPGSLSKGDPVIARGRLYSKEFEHEGARRVSLELDARAVGPDLSLCTATLHRIPRDGSLIDSAYPSVAAA